MYSEQVVFEDEDTVTISKEFFYQERIDCHKALKENTELKETVNKLQREIQNVKKELDEIREANKLQNNQENTCRRYIRKYKKEKQRRKRVEQENKALKEQEENELLFRISQKLVTERSDFIMYWTNRFRALLSEIDISP